MIERAQSDSLADNTSAAAPGQTDNELQHIMATAFTPRLDILPDSRFTLYGGTAIALHLRQSNSYLVRARTASAGRVERHKADHFHEIFPRPHFLQHLESGAGANSYKAYPIIAGPTCCNFIPGSLALFDRPFRGSANVKFGCSTF